VLLVGVAPAPGAVLLVLDAGILLAVAVDVVLAAPVRPLTFRRGGPGTVRLGESATLTLAVGNPGRRLARLRIRDAWPPSTGRQPAVLTVQLPPGERRVLSTVCTPTRRGDRSPVRVTVRSLGPLRLAGRQGRHAVPGALRVLPPFRSRRLLPEKFARLRIVEGLVATRGAGQGSEFDSLREYVIGDDARSIDWRASARRQSVAVRTYRPERDRRLVLVLDTGRTSAGRVADVTRLDHALDAALLLAALAARAGDRIDLLGHDTQPRAIVEGSRSSAATLPRLVAAMSRLEPVLLEADHTAMAGQILRLAPRRALVVIFTDLVPAVIEEGLLPALPALTARHVVLVAALGDPRVAEMGRTDRSAGTDPLPAIDDVAEAYGAAAATRSLLARARAAEMLRRRGVEVVDAPPHRFASDVSDAYLALKAAGRL
jgi:uncharacterized protein (DUF58 family)